MNFGKKNNRQDEPPPPPSAFRLTPEMEQEMMRDVMPARVSEYAPQYASLRDRIDEAGRLSMQETAKACETVLAEVQRAWGIAEAEHKRVAALVEDTHTKVHHALKVANEHIVRHSENMGRIAEVLEQLREQAVPPAPPPRKVKVTALPAPKDEDEGSEGTP